MRPVHMKVRLRYFTFLLKHVAVCKFDPYIVELWLWKSIWLSGFSFCFSLEFAYVTAVVRVIAREMFFSRLLTCYMDVWSTLPDPFTGCRLCVLGFTQQVPSFFPSSTYTRFLCMIFGHHCHALLPGQKRRKRCSGTLFCSPWWSSGLHCSESAGSLWSLLPLIPLLISPFHAFLLFSRPDSGRNFVRKDSVRMNGVLLIPLVYFQHQDSVLHFLHMWLEITPFREVIVLEEGNQWKGDDVGAKRGQRGGSW